MISRFLNGIFGAHLRSKIEADRPIEAEEQMVSPDVPQVEDEWRDQQSNDKVRIIAKFPEIPVEGRLSLFMNEWKKITDDKSEWICL